MAAKQMAAAEDTDLMFAETEFFKLSKEKQQKLLSLLKAQAKRQAAAYMDKGKAILDKQLHKLDGDDDVEEEAPADSQPEAPAEEAPAEEQPAAE